MLHAPVNETQTKTEMGKALMPEKQPRAFHPRFAGTAGPYLGGPGRQSLANLQAAYGNQAILRALTSTAASTGGPNLQLQRKCACGGTPGPTGECAECQKRKRLGLQTKLTLSKAGDRFEQEADRLADQVLAMPAQPIRSGAEPSIQRVPQQISRQANGAPVSPERAMATPGMPLQPTVGQDVEHRLHLVNQSLSSHGHPLDSDSLSFFSERLQRDFRKVRVHTGSTASAAAQAVEARAFTVGKDIVFAENEFRPQESGGRKLLAHELVHVMQQADHVVPAAKVQRAVTRGAGGCGPATEIDEDDDGAKAAGRTAHRQIQAFVLPAILSEIEIPRGTKRQKANTGCQPEGTNAGFADLLRMSGIIVDIGEIKPYPWAATYGVEEVEHYIRRANRID